MTGPVVKLSAQWCHLQQHPWEIGSVWAEGVGQVRWMGEPNGCNSMAVSALSFRWALFGTGWAVSFLLCTIRLTKPSFQLGPSFLALKFFHSLNRRLLAESADSWDLNRWVWLVTNLHGIAAKGTCVKFGVQKPGRTGNMTQWGLKWPLENRI